MGITSASLSTKIQAEIIVEFGAPNDSSRLTKFCNAIARAIVDEFEQNAVVNSTGTVTSGAGAGGSVTTTGTIE